MDEIDDFIVEDAEREQSQLRLAFCGPSGAGKTATAIRVAGGLVDAMTTMGRDLGSQVRKIGLLDTERKSASLYSGMRLADGAQLKKFSTIKMQAPYSCDRYVAAARKLVMLGFPVVIVDQLSHAWSGTGGLLDKKVQLMKEGYNGFDAHEVITPDHMRFMDQMLALDVHLICTMRAKSHWLIEKYEKGGREKSRYTRIGGRPDQKPGAEYEFTTMINLELDGNAGTIVKDRSGVFGMPGTQIGRLTEMHGQRLAEWLYIGREFFTTRKDATPSELLAAAVSVARSSFSASLNQPDLAAAFAEAQTALRRIEAPGAMRQSAIDELVAAKEVRKFELGVIPSEVKRPPEGSTLPPDEVAQIENYAGQCGVQTNAVANHFKVARLAMLPKGSSQEVLDWIDAQYVVGQKAATS